MSASDAKIRFDKRILDFMTLQGGVGRATADKITFVKPDSILVGRVWCTFPAAFGGYPVHIREASDGMVFDQVQIQGGGEGDYHCLRVGKSPGSVYHWVDEAKMMIHSQRALGLGGDLIHQFAKFGNELPPDQGGPGDRTHPTHMFMSGTDKTKWCCVWYDGTNLKYLKEDGSTGNLA